MWQLFGLMSSCLNFLGGGLMKKLIITEKPSVAQDFARVLRVSGKHDGYIENDNYVITWCVGHLVNMSYPEKYDEKLKRWSLDTLPFLPDTIRYEIASGVKKQYHIVEKQLHRSDVDIIYWAGDSGREGQVIEEYLRIYAKVRSGIVEKRVWIDSQTDEAILMGIREAKDMSYYKNIGDAGILRGIEDYFIGINFSRVLSLKYGGFLMHAFGDEKKKVVSVGRVMTCVLGMVVEREREIRSFKSQKYYFPSLNFNSKSFSLPWRITEKSKYYDSPKIYDNKGFYDKEVAQLFINRLMEIKKASVANVEKKESKKNPPLLFNLAELQSVCGKTFHISPSKALAIAQSLYEKKMTTYPRTDARVLSSAVAGEITKNIKGISSLFEEKIISSCINMSSTISSSKYVDDSKITDHYAIIPTGNIKEIDNLKKEEKEIFYLICKRFLSIFLPPALYDNVSLSVNVGNENFRKTFKTIKFPGFLSFAKDGIEADMIDLSEFNDLKVGDVLTIKDIDMFEQKTNPPARYTSGSMILAMENAGKYIEDEELREQIKGNGIGTSATRAGIIDKLVNISYINQNEKTQVLSPTDGGEVAYEIVSATVPNMLNAEFTARWEKELSSVEQGNTIFEDAKEKLYSFVFDNTKKIKEDDKNLEIQEATKRLQKNIKIEVKRHALGVKCPLCGGMVMAHRAGFSCENNKKEDGTCDFFIGKICDVLLSDQEARELILKKRTPLIKGLKGKKGSFDAFICLEVNGKEKSLRFEFPPAEKIEGIKCPKCGSDVLDNNGRGVVCINNDIDENKRKCDFFLYKYAGKTIPIAQIKKLISEGKTDVMTGFKSKNKPDAKPYAASLYFDNDKNIKMRFVDDEEVLGVKCPVCGGKIFKNLSRGFFCENNSGKDTGCNFFAGNICGKKINEDMLKTILSGKMTDVIVGFKSKEKKEFSAALCWDNENKRISFVRGDEKFLNAKCPVCGGKIKVIPGLAYVCENNSTKEEERKCDFFIGKICGKLISDKDAEELISKGKTDKISGFTSKEKKKFSAALRLNEDKTGIVFDFPDGNGKDSLASSKTDFICPKCKSNMFKNKSLLRCGCGIEIPLSISDHKMTDDEMRCLIQGNTLNLSGLISSKGKLYNCKLKIDVQKGELEREFS